jgi:hydrogen peroxide-dependent heme synthase
MRSRPHLRPDRTRFWPASMPIGAILLTAPRNRVVSEHCYAHRMSEVPAPTEVPNAGGHGPLVPTVGWGVLHLFFRVGPLTEADDVLDAVTSCQADGHQVVSFAVLGHKADLGVMAVGPDLWRLRRLQTDLAIAGLDLVDSYVSMTEVSEYAKGAPEAHIQARLYPVLPPAGMRAMCFYPMSKRRGLGADDANWFTETFENRSKLMHEHGTSGRMFAGRIAQFITGSTGFDDYEWGVTLFAHDPADLKEVVYTMRFDEGSAKYAEFGAFTTCLIAEMSDVLREIGFVSPEEDDQGAYEGDDDRDNDDQDDDQDVDDQDDNDD